VRAELAAAEFPVDTFWLDIDYMDRYRDFTLSEAFPQAGVRAWVDALHAAGQRFMVINDPGIASGYARGEYPPYDSGLAEGVFIRESADSPEPARGAVWPGATVFADFSAPQTLPWWRRWVRDFHDAIGSQINSPVGFGSEFRSPDILEPYYADTRYGIS
jgi:alpha-glucosidase (family GH31 glycosyl hydrolase)